MASPSPSISTPPDAPIPDEEPHAADMPLTMAASVVLDHLPKDAHQALENAGELPQAKITVRFNALPATPALRQPRFKISSTQRFEAVVRFLRRKLALKDHESVFCYVNSVFAPGLDEGVGNLWRCFKTGDELVVAYSVTQAFG
ncbi:Ubiquitin-like protein [Zalaria obscura]|uniref:Ubiquitin-like protein n=1 Tax=Zalaria obscura TaxID=2024903 RepID=A0ACC3S4X7_9PEZI